MDDKQLQKAFNNNVPDGYDADIYHRCPVCSKGFQTSPGDAVCPEQTELSFTIEDKQIQGLSSQIEIHLQSGCV